jgi:GH25 family lysozyme M1 (1,4-beta-N-acetylmuramidase)
MSRLLRVTTLRLAAIGGVAAALSLAALPGARATVAPTAGTPVRGVDISAFQHAGPPINWALLAEQGVRFASVKVSEGTYYLNPYYKSDAQAAAVAGLQVMPYVFANPGSGSGTATANFAVSATGTLKGSAWLPFVVDLENDPYKKHADCYGLKIPAMIAWIAQFTTRARALTGRWPIIYTTAYWWQECTGSTGKFGRDPLWLAAFGGTAPAVPSPWLHWTFWQYNNNGTLPGIGHTDLDYFEPSSIFPSLRPPAAKPHPAKPHKAPPKPKPAKHKKASPRRHRPRKK